MHISHGFHLYKLNNHKILSTHNYELHANPITQDGSNYRDDITEEQAFIWFDEAEVFVKGGSGGPGAATYKFGKGRVHVAPSGGSGGDGGNVIFFPEENFNTLLGFRGNSNFKAENGQPGGVNFLNGCKGNDIRVPVPLGTVIYCNQTKVKIGELMDLNQELVVAKGGLGGKGNAAPTQRTRGEKSVATPPSGGEKKWLKLELRLVADIGLVGGIIVYIVSSNPLLKLSLQYLMQANPHF